MLVSLAAVAVASGAAVGAVPALHADTESPACPADRDDAVTWVRGPAADRDRLDGWCAGVGPSVVAPIGSAAGQRALTTKAPVVVSWNTNVGGGDLQGFIADLRAGRLTDGDSVEHFVLLLQEVYRRSHSVPRGAATRPRRIASHPERGRRMDVVEVARDHDLHLFYVPSMANGWVAADSAAEDRGNAILSTLPLDGYTAIELPFEGQRRVAASAIVRSTATDGRVLDLRVVSVHLDNRSTFARFGQSFGRGRARQAEALTQGLQRDAGAYLPTVVAGDLNTWAPARWEGALAVLRAHFPHGNATDGPTFAGRPLGVGRTLDHMMFRLPEPALSGRQSTGPSASGRAREFPAGMPVFEPPVSVRLDHARGSDHYPLLARLAFANPG